jgi:hypothetical protein
MKLGLTVNILVLSLGFGAVAVAKPAAKSAEKTTTKPATVAKSARPVKAVKASEPAPVIPRGPTPENLIISDCNCSLPYMDPGKIAYEDDRVCTPDRRYFEKPFALMPNWIKEERKPFPEAQFGRECVALVQKTFLSSAQKVKSQLFTTCGNTVSWKKNGKLVTAISNEPRRGNKIACVTKDYVNSVYNAFVDVSDCLNIPQHDLLAKLYNESGLHLNTYGPNGDTGLGQLTEPAINSILQPYYREGGRITVRDYFLAQVGRSDKASCQRIINYPAAFQKVDTAKSNRCSLIQPPENPYRNMLYTGLFYRASLSHIADIKYIAGKDYLKLANGELQEVVPGKDFEPGGLIAEYEIKSMLKQLGLKNPDMHAVVRALVTLGYNAGPGKAPIYLKVYLKKRLAAKKYLKPGDVDFLLTDFIRTTSKLVGPIAKEDKKVKPAVLSARQSAYLKSIPEFFMLVQDSGAPGYLSRVAEKHKELQRLMGNDKCVSKDFIHF